MAPRFFSSPYKNAAAQTAKKESWWSELPVSTSAHTDSANLIKAGSEYWVAQGSASGHLICLPYDQPGKFNSRAPTLHAASRAITDFDLSPFDDLLAAGTEDGSISIHSLPPLSAFTASDPLSSSPLHELAHPSGRAIDVLAFHPTTSSILLAASHTTVAIYDLSSFAPEPAFLIEQKSAVWSAAWSLDGGKVSTTGKDGVLRVYDVRKDAQTPVMETLVHAGPKCSRHVWLRNDQIFTTGFSKARDREFALWDATSGKALKTQRLDTNTGVLMPVVDVERSIVYLAGRGDMTVRWVEVGGPAVFTEGGAPIPTTIAGLAVLPPAILNLMKAEINRLVILTSDTVLPISIEVPRRQYIDFHADLFPPKAARVSAQDATAWIAGRDALLDLVPQDPTHKATPIPQARPAPPPAVVAAPPATVTSAPPPVAAAPAKTPSPTSSAPAAAMSNLSLKTSTPSPSATPIVPTSTPAAQFPTPATRHALPKPSPTTATSAVTPSSSPAPKPSSSTPFNPKWSRKFLTGKTHLKPDYDDVHGLSSTMGADAQMLKANHLFFFFPLAGAGGRLGVHRIADTGRMPTATHSIVAGAAIVDYELDPFDPTRVFVACEHSRIRSCRIPEGGLEEDWCEVEVAMVDSGMDRIGEVQHHPTAKDLLLSVSDDHGEPTLRLWDVAKGTVLLRVALPAGGVSSTAWSPDGKLLAVATKTKTILLLDPRVPSSLTSTPSHDSVRPVRVAWISPTHLISTGFSKTASREVILYALAADGKISQVAKQTLDVSPAPLFPYADMDTRILLLYSRGERSCHAFEVQPEDRVPFSPLPSFEHSTLQAGFAFLSKARNDVRAVEVLHALRLTPHTVEVVSFSVPRARVEFFQDDVFVPTRDVETPSLSAAEWVAGKDVPLAMLDLRPADMTPLSQAPMTAARASTRSKISGPVITDSMKQEAYMARLFDAAKADGDLEEPIRSSHAPDDDDW